MTPENDLKQKTKEILEDLNPMLHLQNLDFPRRSGTDGEREAAAYIAHTLKENGYQPNLQEFHYPKAKVLPKILPPLIFLAWIILSLVNIRTLGNNQIITFIILSLPLALILVILNFGRLMMYSSARRTKKLKKIEKEVEEGVLALKQVTTSRNVVAETGPKDAEQEILFTAHFDSISSKIPMPLMTVSMIIGVIGLLLYSILYLANAMGEANFMGQYFTVFVIYAAILTLLFGILFASRSLRGNESHGSIDDGTGVAILLELAKFVKNHPIPGYKFIFGFFGSEEAGLIGSTYHYMNRKIDKNKLRVISVDMIGEKPPLAYVKGISMVRKARMEPAFNQEIKKIAEALHVEIKGKNFPYPGSDFAPFMLQGGCRANWLINSSRLIHSKNDHLGNVNEGLVKDALKLMVAHLLQKGEKSP